MTWFSMVTGRRTQGARLVINVDHLTYLQASGEAAEPIAAGLGQHPPVSDISVKHFEVPNSLTAITRGPV